MFDVIAILVVVVLPVCLCKGIRYNGRVRRPVIVAVVRFMLRGKDDMDLNEDMSVVFIEACRRRVVGWQGWIVL